jgi:hypothetical protein
MDESSFAQLVGMGTQQPDAQRLLFVSAGVELPDDASPDQRARFERGAGGALAPLMTGDKAPTELSSFEALVSEADAMRADWKLVFVAALIGQGARAPSDADVERALKRIEDGIKQGNVGALLVLEREGQAVQLR